jgi:hypothetical protein
VAPVTGHHQDKIIGLCRVPDYAELVVKVLARAVDLAVGSA